MSYGMMAIIHCLGSHGRLEILVIVVKSLTGQIQSLYPVGKNTYDSLFNS